MNGDYLFVVETQFIQVSAKTFRPNNVFLHCWQKVPVGSELLQNSCQVHWIAGIAKKTVNTVLNEFRNSSNATSNDWNAGRQGFQYDQSPCFFTNRRDDHDVDLAKQSVQVVWTITAMESCKVFAVLLTEQLKIGIRPIAKNVCFEHSLVEHLQCFDQDVNALPCIEISKKPDPERSERGHSRRPA